LLQDSKSQCATVCRSVFLTIWHCNLSALLQTVFWQVCPLGSLEIALESQNLRKWKSDDSEKGLALKCGRY